MKPCSDLRLLICDVDALRICTPTDHRHGAAEVGMWECDGWNTLEDASIRSAALASMSGGSRAPL